MAESSWEIAEPRKFSFDEPVSSVRVRIARGAVNVVGTEESAARLEVSEIDGPPLRVTREGTTLTVAYDDLPWKGFLKWLDRKAWRRHAVVSLVVPSGTDVEVGTVGATAMVSGVEGRTAVRGVHGETTLAGLSGDVHAETVSGTVEVQGVTGDLKFSSVSGDLTVVAAGASVRAESVSGDMIVDLDGSDRAPDVRLSSVSGEIAIRLPHPADAVVEADTTSGTVSNAFEDLRVGGGWGTKKITGRLGAGTGTLKATTVSGAIALLRRPQPDAYETHETYETHEAREPHETHETHGEGPTPDASAPQADGNNPPTDTPPADTPPAGDSTTGKVL
ncbi:DUF4097 family beta strand repeat-containing protein [Streptomyces sp. LHD-70]|uniref:DUF4097 family beta strand repeat-containing protein n=1 Tax=Streptomyces sp. LHD-70 TaxID=3072140 RepID=UPI00280E9802|nr:DUF4097 family beta strand repeat-containing protein [Streptomyces sp. LHD-70]MDQ8702150.1 DUF4097 family beta strand repeat-containing protein [Streptomyces sp. LHD-70]